MQEAQCYNVQCSFAFRAQAWKAGNGAIGKCLPKFKPNPVDEEPIALETPEFLICSVDDRKQLTVPGNIRAQWIADPIRSREWKVLLQAFDQKWSAPEPNGTINGNSHSTQPTSPTKSADPVDGTAAGDEFDWTKAFPGEPTTAQDLETKYGTAAHSFMLNTELQACIHEGPKLFLRGVADGEIDVDEPALTFGAGTWVLHQKAKVFKEDCVFFFDVLVFGTRELVYCN